MALPVMEAAGVQHVWAIAVGEQTAVAILGAALVTSAIRRISETAQFNPRLEHYLSDL